MGDSEKGLKVETYRFNDDGTVPNNPLPLVVYRRVLAESGDRAAACEAMFARNGWPGAWHNGIYGHHHYHSTAHEVLGIAACNARVRLGGGGGGNGGTQGGGVGRGPPRGAPKRGGGGPPLPGTCAPSPRPNPPPISP